jgi:hypothetical protein
LIFIHHPRLFDATCSPAATIKKKAPTVAGALFEHDPKSLFKSDHAQSKSPKRDDDFTLIDFAFDRARAGSSHQSLS